MRTGLLSLLVACCLVTSIVGAVVPAGAPAAPDASAKIEVTRHYSNPDGSDGNVTVTVTYEFADAAVEEAPSEFLAPGTEVLSTSGFTVESSDRGRVAVWDGESSTATIRFRRPVSYLIAGEEGDGWALLNTFRGERYYGQYDATLRVTGEPAAAFDDRTVFVGAHETYRTDAGNHVVQLVVAGAANPANSPETILSTLRFAGRRLGGGPGMRGETVTVFVKPGYGGQVLPGSDFLMGEHADITEPGSGYLEEYGHILQPIGGTRSMDWMVDGYAMYYDHYYPLLRGASWASFRQAVNTTRERRRHIVLANKSTWYGDETIFVGSKAMSVLAALDIRIQRATDGEKQLRHVFQRMYGSDVTAEEFQRLCEQVAGREFDAFFDRYVFGRKHPTLPAEPPAVYVNGDTGGTPTPSPTPTATPTPTSTTTPTSTPSPTASASATGSPGTPTDGGMASPTSTATGTDDTATTGDGFGVALALVVLVVLTVAAVRRD